MSSIPTGFGCYTLPPSFSPDSIDTLIAWYDSNSAQFNETGIMTNWVDKSGFLNSVTNFQTGSSASNYDFTQRYGSTYTDMKFSNAGATIFAVCSLKNLVGNRVNNLVSIFTSNINSPGYDKSNFTVSIYADNTGNNFFAQTYDLSNRSTYSNNLASNTFTFPNRFIVNGICFNTNVGGSFSRSYINGSINSCNSNPIILSQKLSDFRLFIGDFTTASVGFDGMTHIGNHHIYEVLIYNTVLSQTQISQINQYLQAKNGTAALANSGNFTY